MSCSFKQLPLDSAKPGLSLVVAYSRLVPEQIEERTGLNFEIDHGELGPMDAALVESSSGRQFGLFRLHNAPLQEHTSMVVSENTEDITHAVDEILECLKIYTKEMRSFHFDYKFRPFKVLWRNVLGLVSTAELCHSKSDAILASKKLAALKDFEASWVEPEVN